MKKKRTVSLDACDESLIVRITHKFSPFASPHRIVQLALKYGLKVMHDDPNIVREHATAGTRVHP